MHLVNVKALRKPENMFKLGAVSDLPKSEKRIEKLLLVHFLSSFSEDFRNIMRSF